MIRLVSRAGSSLHLPAWDAGTLYSEVLCGDETGRPERDRGTIEEMHCEECLRAYRHMLKYAEGIGVTHKETVRLVAAMRRRRRAREGA